MKKLISALLVLSLLIALAACGESPASGKAPAPASSRSESTAITAPEDGEIPFEEIIAVDNEECTIKITGIDPDNLWGFTLKAQLENKSADKTYMFSVDSAAINGIQCDPLFSAEVSAGKKSNEEISFTTDELEEQGLCDFTDIQLSFRVFDSNDWMADAVAQESIHVYPYGEDKAMPFVREAQDSDLVLVDNAYVTAIVTGYENDDLWGYSVNLFLQNKTDYDILFSVDEASVNGFMADPLFAVTVSAGNCAFRSICWFPGVLEENQITDIEEIEFLFHAYDADDWFSNDLVYETITLNP